MLLAVHAAVRRGEQLAHARPVVRERADAEAAERRRHLVVQAQLPHRSGDALRHGKRVITLMVWKDHGELIAPQTRRDRRFAAG